MQNEYDVLLGSEKVGTASVTREGLYYRISCQCSLSGSVPCCITARAERETNLGLCVPREDKYGLETRIPIKSVGEGNLAFQVSPKHRANMELFIPMAPEEPFCYIARLKDAYLICRDGQVGITITDQSAGPQDSDQSP